MRIKFLIAIAVVLAAGAATAVLARGSTASVSGAAVLSRPVSSPSLRTIRLAEQIAAARLATARYATDLALAKADGYRIITPMIPDMGFHFLNPDVQGFDVGRPPILVYVRRGDEWQLVALEWVFTEKPARPPLPGARYGSFAAACHYEDGTFVAAESEAGCATATPEGGSPFSFWHPELVTLHFWVWYPNPRGIFNGTNPLVRPFNE